MSPNEIITALRQVRYPGTGEDIVSAGMVEDDIRIQGYRVSFSIIFKKDNDPFRKSLLKAAEAAIKTYVNRDAEVVIHEKTPSAVAPEETWQSPNIFHHIIAVSSGKGGVGKSTVTSNIAVSLAVAGYRVGLLDADIFGPSQPRMFGIEGYQPVAEEVGGRQLIVPAEQYGVKMLSIGFFVSADNAIVWRGAMASNAIKQLVNDALWGELDYLLIDLPPGTSDIHLTIVQTLKLSGAIVVTTPQPVALIDARRGVDMFRNDKIDVPVLGIIENMSWFTPAELPENKYYIFGKDGGKALAEELNVPLLGQIPLVQSVREGADNGKPVALLQGHPAAEQYRKIAEKLKD
ncbi:MAG: Mrp/NBP35 family ATP-binding protein [Paludibacteraceae bacterium]|nr:Mrp/NBP35 family ATP-binding protein [Paludibacteraceae bacterium]